MGLLDKSLRARKRFNGHNIQMLNALIKLVADNKADEDDDIVISMPPETYDKIKILGLYKEKERRTDRRREDRRSNSRRSGDRRDRRQ